MADFGILKTQRFIKVGQGDLIIDLKAQWPMP